MKKSVSLGQQLLSIVNEIIEEKHRDEVINILNYIDVDYTKEIIEYYKNNDYHMCNMCLDIVKSRNMEIGNITRNNGDYFGDPFLKN